MSSRGWSGGVIVLGKHFQCRGVLLFWIIMAQAPAALAVDAGGVCSDFFLSSFFSHVFLPLSGRRSDID